MLNVEYLKLLVHCVTVFVNIWKVESVKFGEGGRSGQALLQQYLYYNLIYSKKIPPPIPLEYQSHILFDLHPP